MAYAASMPTPPTSVPAWLDERENRAWRGLHRIRTALFPHLARELTASCGLSQAEFEILVVVSEAPDRRIRARELGTALQWERSRLSHQIARMEERGTITRAPCDGDARGFDVILTPAGLEAIETAAPLNLERVRHCFIDVLSPAQLDALGDIADAVAAHMEREHPDSRSC
jgi:DNA-binding MarR family transcriptional regulator